MSIIHVIKVMWHETIGNADFHAQHSIATVGIVSNGYSIALLCCAENRRCE